MHDICGNIWHKSRAKTTSFTREPKLICLMVLMDLKPLHHAIEMLPKHVAQRAAYRTAASQSESILRELFIFLLIESLSGKNVLLRGNNHACSQRNYLYISFSDAVFGTWKFWVLGSYKMWKSSSLVTYPFSGNSHWDLILTSKEEWKGNCESTLTSLRLLFHTTWNGCSWLHVPKVLGFFLLASDFSRGNFFSAFLVWAFLLRFNNSPFYLAVILKK